MLQEYLAKLGSYAGIVPPADVAAQKRCYDYLKQATTEMQNKIELMAPTPEPEPGVPGGDDPASLMSNQMKIINDIISLVENSQGRHNYKKARMFWEYWDKVRITAVRAVEEDGQDINNAKMKDILEELEYGRHC
jgi:hypothetical protein